MANTNFPTAQSQKVVALWPNLNGLADEGSLYIASTTQIASGQAAGTGIATTTSVVDDAATASTTHAQYSPVLYLANTASPSDPNGKTVYPLWLRMLCTAAPTSSTFWAFAIRADNTPGGRVSTAGTALTPINVNTGSSNASKATIQIGTVVVALAGSNQRVLGSGYVQATIPIVKDQWIFTFGDITAPTNILTASALKNLTIPCYPFAVAPGWNITLEMWGGSNGGAASWEFELGYAERVSGL